MRRLWVSVVFMWLIASTVCIAKDFKVHGFVTAVNSPTNFEIDDYKIMRSNTLSLEVEKEEGEDSLAAFKPEDIRVGTELEIKGDYDESTGELRAKSIKVFLNDTRRIKRTALIEKVPSLQKADSGWAGTVAADGQRVVVVPTTVVVFKSNKSERKQARGAKDDTSPVASADVLSLDTFMHYEGTRQPDGSILAQQVEFEHAELEDGEAKMWGRLNPKVKDPDFSRLRPGELKLEKTKYKLVASKEAQEYISALGTSVIPAHQKELPAGDPLKIPFRFYLIEDRSFNAAAYPNGVVIVHSGVFDAAQNEAQLAFVLSHEITHAIEKHTWRQHEYHKKALTALRIGGAVGAGFGGRGISDMTTLVEAAIRNGYARSLENQADRVGLEWMLAAGYDIREAPQSWKAVARKYGDRRTNFFWDSHDNNATRRSYLMAEIKNNYSEIDFSKLKKDSDQFHHIAEVVGDAGKGKKEMKMRVRKAETLVQPQPSPTVQSQSSAPAFLAAPGTPAPVVQHVGQAGVGSSGILPVASGGTVDGSTVTVYGSTLKHAADGQEESLADVARKNGQAKQRQDEVPQAAGPVVTPTPRQRYIRQLLTLNRLPTDKEFSDFVESSMMSWVNEDQSRIARLKAGGDSATNVLNDAFIHAIRNVHVARRTQ